MLAVEFNECALLQLVSWTNLMTSTLDLETLFLEVLKTPKTIQLQAKCVLSKDYPITTKNFTYVLNM